MNNINCKTFKKILLAAIGVIIFLFSCSALINHIKYDGIKLTKEEKQWLKTNKGKELTAYVPSEYSMYLYRDNDKEYGVFIDLENYMNELYDISISTKEKELNQSDIIWAVESDGFDEIGYIKSSPYDYAHLNLYSDKNLSDILDKEDMVIAVDSVYTGLIENYDSRINFKEFNSTDELHKLYEEQVVDGVITDNATMLSLKMYLRDDFFKYKFSDKFDSKISLAVKEDEILLSLMNKALKNLEEKKFLDIKNENKIRFIRDTLPFTEEEQRWLNENKKIPINVRYKLEPYYYDGGIGLLNSYLNELESILDIEFVDIESLGNGYDDAMVYFGVTKNEVENNNLEIISNYYANRSNIYSNFDNFINDTIEIYDIEDNDAISNLKKLEGYTIGVTREVEKEFLENHLVNPKINVYKNHDDMIEALDNEEVDYIIGGDVIMNFKIHDYWMYQRIFEVGTINHVFYEYIAVNSDEKILTSIMKKVSNSMNMGSELKYNEILVKNHPYVNMKNLILLIILLIIIVTVIFIYTFILEREIKTKRLISKKLENSLGVNKRLVHSLIETLEDVNGLKDNDTGQHIKRIGLYCVEIAKQLNCDEDFINSMEQFASLHDIGKVGIEDKILKKPGKLTNEEMEKMKQHVEIGYELIRKHKLGKIAENIILYHHERYDGNGYLNNLEGKNIPIEARILTLADVYDALRMERVYKKGFSHNKAIEIILSERGKQFDPDIVDAVLIINDKLNRIYAENK